MALVTSVKNQIKALLETLVRDGTLGVLIVDDLKLGIFDRDYGAFPVAVLSSAAIEGGYFTSAENTRTYTFDVMVILKGEDVQDVDTVESLMETLLDKFDLNETLGGTVYQLEPSVVPAEALTSRGKTYVVFSVTLKARGVTNLT